MKDSPKPDNRGTYDAAFRADALRLAAQSRSTQAAARVLNTDPKRLYQEHIKKCGAIRSRVRRQLAACLPRLLTILNCPHFLMCSWYGFYRRGKGLLIYLAAGEAQDFITGAARADLEVGHELASGLLAGSGEFLDGGRDFLVARGQARRRTGVRHRVAGRAPARWC